MKKAVANLATGVIAIACLASSAGATRFRGRGADPNWKPAQETAAPIADELPFIPQLVLDDYNNNAAVVEPPATTAPAVLKGKIDERDATNTSTNSNTCAYVSGVTSLSLYCGLVDECVAYSTGLVSYVGCCPTTSTSCTIQTVCLASSQSEFYTPGVSGTLYCSSSEYPACITYTYADYLSGFSIVGCGQVKSIEPVYYTAFLSDANASPSTTPRTTTPTPSTTTCCTPPPTPTTPTPTPTPTNNGGGGTNTGAIAGGVVGGVAALGLIGLGAFFLMRRSNNNNNNANNAAGNAGNAGNAANVGGPQPPPGPQPQQPPMGQVHQDPYYGGMAPAAGAAAAGGLAGAGAAAYQQHQDLNKAYDGYGSPYPAAPSVSPGATSPVPPHSPNSAFSGYANPDAVAAAGGGQPQYGGQQQHGGQISPADPIGGYQAPPPAPGMGFHSGPVPTTLDAAELPTERADGELRELA